MSLCPILMPAVPYTVTYGCGTVSVTDPNGVTQVYTQLVKYSNSSITLTNNVVTSVYDTVPSFDLVQLTSAFECTNATGAASLDPEVVCLSDGTNTVTGWEVFDNSTNPPTSTLYVGGVVVTGYTVVPCTSTGIDREIVPVCVDGLTWTKVITFVGNLPVSILWLDETDTPVATPATNLIDNANCNSCIQTPQGVLTQWG